MLMCKGERNVEVQAGAVNYMKRTNVHVTGGLKISQSKGAAFVLSGRMRLKESKIAQALLLVEHLETI